MEPRILILYGTTEGQTRKIAGALAATLRSADADVDVRAGHDPINDPRPEEYDAVIVAASVHAGGYQRGVRRWVAAHATELASKPTAFVSVCLGVLEHNPKTDKDLAAIMTKFFVTTGWRPSITKVVAGALPYTKYNWLKRLVMRRIAAKVSRDTDTRRDYEYTDWNDVRAFAREFLRMFERVHGLPAAG